MALEEIFWSYQILPPQLILIIYFPQYRNTYWIDSFGFMASSPSQMLVDLKQGGLDEFKNVSQEFGSDEELTELMTRKGIYPYSFMDSYDKFDIDPLSGGTRAGRARATALAGVWSALALALA